MTLILWSGITIIFFSYGMFTLRLWQKLLRTTSQSIITISPALVLLTGLAVLTAGLMYIALWRGFSGLGVRVPLLILPMVYLMVDTRWCWQYLRAHFKWPQTAWGWLSFVLFVLWITVIAYQSAVVPPHPDMGLYHGQTILWLQQFGLVPGLGNLLPNIAFNSSWFYTAAFFNIKIDQYELMQSLNGWLLVVVSGWLFVKINQLRDQVSSSRVAALLLGVGLGVTSYFNEYYYFFHPYLLSTPATELPSFLIPLVLIILGLELAERAVQWNNPTTQLLVLAVTCLSVLAVTVKLSALAFTLLPLYYLVKLLHQGKSARASIVVIVTGLFILLGWIGGNIMLSGYVVYPLPISLLDWVNVDWKIPYVDVQVMSDVVKGWAIHSGVSAPEALGSGITYWFPQWFSNFIRHPLLLYLVLPALGIHLVYAFWQRRAWLNYVQQNVVLIFILILQLLIWFQAAPDIIRFGLGLFLGIAILALVPVLQLFMQQIKPRLAQAYLLPLVLVFLLGQASWVVDFTYAQQAWLWFIPIVPPVYTPQPLGDYQVNVRPYCWNSPLPCTSILNPALELRGNDLKYGFRIQSNESL